MVNTRSGRARRASFFVACLAVWTGTDGLAAQDPATFTLAGEIVDAVNGAPVVAAVIKVPELRRFVFTNVSGRFAFTDFPEGTWDIQVEQLGYHTLEGSVTVADGNGLFLRLNPDPIELEGLRVVTRGERLLHERRRRYPFRVTTISASTITAAADRDLAAIFRRHANAPLAMCPAEVDPWLAMGGCMYKRGDLKRINVYLDEAPLMGGMVELSQLDYREIHAMDWLPGIWRADNPELRVYTKRFIERLSTSNIHLAPFSWFVP